MGNQGSKIFYLILVIAVLFGNGCASMQQVRRAGALEKEVVALKDSLKTKQWQINRLQELLDGQQVLLRDLNDKLNECKKNSGNLTKKQRKSR